MRRVFIAYVLVFVAGLLFQWSISFPKRTFIGFSKISWSSLGGCRLVNSNAHKFENLSRTVTWDRADPNRTASCTSDWLVVRGNYLELEIAGYVDPKQQGSVELLVEGGGGEVLGRFFPRSEQQSGVWKRAISVVRDRDMVQRVRLKIDDNSSGAGWIALRNRANFYEVPLFEYDLFRLFRKGHWKKGSACLFAVAVAYLF